MQSKAKSNSRITTRLTEVDDGEWKTAVEFTVLGGGVNGESDTFTVFPGRMSAGNRARAMVHGIVQKVSDAAAKSVDTATGKSASPFEKAQAMRRVAEHLNSGSEDWSPARVQVVRVAPGLDKLAVSAVSEATGRGEEEVREMVKKGAEQYKITQDAFLAKLCQSKSVAPILERLRAELVQAEFDPDDILVEMMGKG